MNRDEIIRMAREAGVDDWWDSGNEQREVLQEVLERFFHLAYAAGAAGAADALAEPVQEPVVNHYESDLDMVKCRQIAREYAWPNSNIDSGNLYWALHVALRHVAPPQRPAEPVAYSEGRTLHWHDGKGVNDAQLYLAPPQRKPVEEPVKQCMAHGECFGGKCIYQPPAEPVQEPVEPVEWSHINGTSDTKWHPPQRKPPATIDEMFDRMDKAPKGVFYGHDPMMIWMEAWRAAEQHHGVKP